MRANGETGLTGDSSEDLRAAFLAATCAEVRRDTLLPRAQIDLFFDLFPMNPSLRDLRITLTHLIAAVDRWPQILTPHAWAQVDEFPAIGRAWKAAIEAIIQQSEYAELGPDLVANRDRLYGEMGDYPLAAAMHQGEKVVEKNRYGLLQAQIVAAVAKFRIERRRGAHDVRWLISTRFYARADVQNATAVLPATSTEMRDSIQRLRASRQRLGGELRKRAAGHIENLCQAIAYARDQRELVERSGSGRRGGSDGGDINSQSDDGDIEARPPQPVVSWVGPGGAGGTGSRGCRVFYPPERPSDIDIDAPYDGRTHAGYAFSQGGAYRTGAYRRSDINFNCRWQQQAIARANRLGLAPGVGHLTEAQAAVTIARLHRRIESGDRASRRECRLLAVTVMILMTGRSFGEVVRTRIALDWHEPTRERPITVDIGGGWIGLRCSRVEMPAAPHGLADRQSPTADFACVSMPNCLGAFLSSSVAAPPEGASISPWLKLDRRVWRAWWTDALAETCRDIGGSAQAGALEHFLWRRLITGTADAVTHAKWLTGRSSIVVQNAIAYTAVTPESYRRAHAEALRPLEETLAALLPKRAADRIGDASRPPINPAIGSRRVPLQETQRLAADFYVNSALDASDDLDQPLLWRSAHDRLVQYTGAMFLAATGCRPHGWPMLEARLYAGSRQPIVCSDKDSDDFSMARALVMPRLLLDQVEALRQLQQRWAAMSSNPGWRCWHAPPTRVPKARAQARTFMRAREPGICALDDSAGGSATAGGYTLRPRDLLTYTQMQRNGFRSALRTFLSDKGFFQYEIDAWMGHQVHGRDVAAPTATMPIRPVLQSMANAVDEMLRALGWRVIPRRVG